MAFIFDIPGEMKALYGVRAEAFYLKENERSKQGEPYWDVDRHGRWYFMPVWLGGVQLCNPIMRIIGRKTVIETPLTERPGSVKEVISLDDYVINIRGIIKRPDDSYPEEELQDLVDMYVRQSAVDIDSPLTSIFLKGRDKSVLITNIGKPEGLGQSGVVYDLEMVSDTAFELEIDD